jgi:hypothetical protein
MNLSQLKQKTYLQMIKNSIGTKLFKSYFMEDKNRKRTVDIYRNGRLSCAAFVTSILYLNGLIDAPHATVKKTREKMVQSSWKKIDNKDMKPGDVIIWEKMKINHGTENEHIGFVLNKNQAISNSHQKRQIVKHHTTYNNKRKIKEVFSFNF